MATYAENGGWVIAVHDSRGQARFEQVCDVSDLDVERREELVTALDAFSSAVWATYGCSHPDYEEGLIHPELAARELVGGFDDATLAMHVFYLPWLAGTNVWGCALGVLRVLEGIADECLTAAVSREVSVELAAIREAEAGVFDGRSAHGLRLSPPNVNDELLVVAHELIAARDWEALWEVQATTACVAVLEWFEGAVRVIAKATKRSIAEVCEEIAELNGSDPQVALGLVGHGESGFAPREVIEAAVCHARRERVVWSPRDPWLGEPLPAVPVFNPVSPSVEMLEFLLEWAPTSELVWHSAVSAPLWSAWVTSGDGAESFVTEKWVTGMREVFWSAVEAEVFELSW